MQTQADERATVARPPLKAAPRGDVSQLLAPVQDGLKAVEAKLKGVDSALFDPLATAFIDLIGSGGKRLRPALALLAYGLEPSVDESADSYARVVSLAASVEMLHTATLVHDDVIDDALLRRGAPTLNASWTKGATVLAGNFMFGRAAYFSSETGDMRVIDIFSDTLQVIVNGELRQLFARFDYVQDKEEYYQRIYAKTASLFCAATEGAAILAGMNETQATQLREFGYNLGMAFQIVDDILDFTSDDNTLGKPAGSDLRQGTLTLPFFHYLNCCPQPEALLENLEEQFSLATMDGSQIWDETIQRTVQDLCNSPAIEMSRQEALGFVTLARQNLEPFPESVYKSSMLGLCDFVVERTF
jgi:geranylgeranyl pyrophosphate synthase